MTAGQALPAVPPHTSRKEWLYAESHVNFHGREVSRPPFCITVPARPQHLTFDLARSAMVVVDMQNDFVSVGGWLHAQNVDVSAAAAAIEPLNFLNGRLRAKQVPIIWVGWGNRDDQLNLPPGIRHVYDPSGLDRGIGARVGRSKSVLSKDSWGTQVVGGLDVQAGDAKVDKFRMSGFFDTPLDSILRQLDVDTVLFGGVNLDQCVFSTLIDAANLGYNVVLIEGCSATTSPPSCIESTLYNIRQCFGFTVGFRAVVAAIDRDAALQAP